VNEDAARKRVTRGLEKLRARFLKRGVTLTVTVIAGAVASNSVQAAPVGMAVKISVVAAKGTAVTTAITTTVKGALKIMAWTKMKTAVAVGVATIVVASTTNVVVEGIFKNLETDQTASEKLESVSPTLLIRPTQYPTNRVGLQRANGKSAVANTSFNQLIRYAYGFTTSVRMILPTNLPTGTFDYFNSLTNQQREVMRAELKKQFGLVAHTEMFDTNVLVLKVKNQNKLEFHLVQNAKPGNLGTFRM
jgi:hypothetical protein